MEPNAAIFEHVTKMGRIGIPAAHKSEPLYRQPSYDFDDLTDTPPSTVRSIDRNSKDVYVDMKLGRNMRARPRHTDDEQSNGQNSDKDLIESLNRQKQTRQQLEAEKEHHQAAVQQEKDRQLGVEAEKRKKQDEQIQKSLIKDPFPLADSLLKTNSPSDQKEQTSVKVIFPESQSGLTKSKNVGDVHVRGVITEKDNDEDDDFVVEKVDSSKEDSDINDF